MLFGANWLVDGSVAVAKRSGLSEFVIGATIVGIGTSMLEFVVSLFAAIKGNADITIGNVAGSNMFNSLFILGITVLISPIVFTKQNLKKDIPLCLVVSCLLAFFVLDKALWGSPANNISRIEALILFAGFIAYMVYSLKHGQKEPQTAAAEPQKAQVSLAKAIFMIVFGLAGLIFGGDLFVDSCSAIAKKMGVSDSIVAITLMAGGTSLPELATCIIAARKNSHQLALGNILGSNISNILLIIGLSGSIVPLSVNSQSFFSLLIIPVSILLLSISAYSFKKKCLDRYEGVIFIILYVAFIITVVNI